MKKIMTIMAAMLLMAGTAKAQVFILENDKANQREGSTAEEINLIIPLQGVDYDQYTPLGSGVLLLAGLGAAYTAAKGKGKRK